MEEPWVTSADLVDEERLHAARKTHLAKIEKFSAVKVVPRSSAMSRPLTTRWVDSVSEHECKSRLTVHGFKQQVDPGTSFYSATPAAPSLRI